MAQARGVAAPGADQGSQDEGPGRVGRVEGRRRQDQGRCHRIGELAQPHLIRRIEIGFPDSSWEKRMLARFGGALAIAVSAITLAFTTLALTRPAGAQPYPNKPVRLVIAFPAGGSIDTLGRILAGKLSEEWGQNVVVENRPGAGGNLGAAAAAQAAPDGYTLHLGAQKLAGNVTIAPHQGLDPARALQPINLGAN